MEVTALCFRLVMLKLIFLREQVHNSYTQNIAFLHITPNRLQHFQFNSVSFDCIGFDGRTHLKGNSKEFNQTFSSRKTTSSFTIDRVYPGDSGEYWCESEGERSDGLNITITAGPLILDSPALPVMQGTNVILHCRSNNKSTNLGLFYKNDVLMHNSSAEETEIKNVSKSDEGFYKCHVFTIGTSPASWLAVRENIISITSYPPNEETTLLKDANDHIVFIILRVLSLVVLLLVVGFFYFKKPKVSYFGPVNGVEVQMNQMA